jgi:hypothetical protein
MNLSGSSQIACQEVGSGVIVAVLARKDSLDENGAQAGAPDPLDAPGLIADHPGARPIKSNPHAEAANTADGFVRGRVMRAFWQNEAKRFRRSTTISGDR